MLNPDLRQRVKIRDYDPDTYEQIDWERVAVVSKRDLLREARISREATGTFSVRIGVSEHIDVAVAES